VGQGIDAAAGLKALEQQFGTEYGKPVVASDGNVYMARQEPEVKAGKLALAYALVARIDKTTGKMQLNPAFMDAQRSKRPPGSKLVEVEGKYFWQVTTKGEDGQLTARSVPVSEAELREMAAQQQQQKSEQATEAWNKNRMDWIQKLSEQSSLMRTVGYSGGLVDSLSRGPNPYTGKTQAHWYTGYMVLQMLDARAEGKLLPQWMKSGPFGTALDWGLQGLFMLDMGESLKTLGAAFPRTGAVMRAFTAPTRAVLKGAMAVGKGAAAATAPAAAATGAAGAAGAASGGMAAARMGMAAQAMGATSAAGAAASSGPASSAITGAMTGLGNALKTGGVSLVGASGKVAGDAALMSAEGALSVVPKGAVHQAMKMTDAPLKGGLKVQEAVSNGVTGTLGALRPFLRTLQVGGSIFGAVAGAMNIGYVVKNGGYQALATTQQGRGALLNFMSSASFLGMLALPVLAPALGVTAAGMGVAYAGLNVASNVFSGVSALNYAGLFGDGGWLDHDGVRAAFLIPPLSPIGLYAMWMKRRKKAEAAKKAQLEAAGKTVQQQVAALNEQAKSQLQQTGAIKGAVQGNDGSLLLPTELPNDIRELAGQKPGPGLPDEMNRTMQLIARPMRAR